MKTPSQNISCFVVHSNLLCDVRRSSYGAVLQHRCIDGPAGLDWHGFELSGTGRARVVCAGGVLYDIGRERPSYRVLAYGRTWHSHRFACTSRVAGLTCTNGRGHGLFLSRESYRLF